MYPRNRVDKISAQLEKLKTIFKGDYQISGPTTENGKIISADIDIWYICDEKGSADKIDCLFEVFKEINKGLGKKGIKLVFFEPATGRKRSRLARNKTSKDTNKNAKN